MFELCSLSCVSAAPQPPRFLSYTRDSTNLTLYHFQWVLDQDPQGVVTKRKVTCTTTEAPPLSMEVGWSEKSVSISGFRYRMQYLCSIQAAASNNLYSAPGGNLTFLVTEEGKRNNWSMLCVCVRCVCVRCVCVCVCVCVLGVCV